VEPRRAPGNQRIISQDGLDIIETPEYHAQALITNLGLRRVPMVVRLHMPAYLCRQVSSVASGNGRLDTLISEKVEYWMVRRARMIVSASRIWRRQSPNIGVCDKTRCVSSLCRSTMRFSVAGEMVHARTVQSCTWAVFRVSRALRSWCRRCHRLSGFAQEPEFDSSETITPPGPVGLDGRTFAYPAASGGYAGRGGGVQRVRCPAHHSLKYIARAPFAWSHRISRVLAILAWKPWPAGAPCRQRRRGLREIISDEVDGLLTPPGCSESLAKAIVRLLIEPQLRKRLASGRR